MEQKKASLDLEERLVNFGCMCLETCELLPGTTAGTGLGQQLLKTGTAAAVHYGEAQTAGSGAEFMQKMKLVLKEIRESRVHLRIIRKIPLATDPKVESTFKESGELMAIFLKSISTVRKNNKKTKEEKPS
jgi:four helix bundle protein